MYVMYLYSLIRHWRKKDYPFRGGTAWYTLKDPDHGIYPMVTSIPTPAAYKDRESRRMRSDRSLRYKRHILSCSRSRRVCIRRSSGMRQMSWEDVAVMAVNSVLNTGRPRRMGWFDCVVAAWLQTAGSNRCGIYRTGCTWLSGWDPAAASHDDDGEVTMETSCYL